MQPRNLPTDAMAVYHDALGPIGEPKLRAAALVLRRNRFFPTTAEWYAEAMKGGRVAHVCPRCENRGIVVVRYHDGAPFDLAICACEKARLFRRMGVDVVRHFVTTAIGGRIRLTDENRIGFVEDFDDDEAASTRST
jgi:hypothetical protein